MDIEKARREELRWLILRTLYAAQPVGTSENVIRNAIEPLMLDITAHEIRRELDYLAERGLVTIMNRDSLVWFAKINDHGVDIVEYTVECYPGIARPKKYW
ncbi:MAG TPA: hypothetical protein PK659_10295 [Methanothrix sp.]|nr:hypothetical protein [Methanothrix sp.]HOL44632.1 hypothetical protein [Methanothrix sp.]